MVSIFKTVICKNKLNPNNHQRSTSPAHRRRLVSVISPPYFRKNRHRTIIPLPPTTMEFTVLRVPPILRPVSHRYRRSANWTPTTCTTVAATTTTRWTVAALVLVTAVRCRLRIPFRKVPTPMGTRALSRAVTMTIRRIWAPGRRESSRSCWWVFVWIY